MRETESRLMHPRKATHENFPTLGVQTAQQEADNVQQRYHATGTLINICVVDRCYRAPATFQVFLAGVRTNAVVRVSRL